MIVGGGRRAAADQFLGGFEGNLNSGVAGASWVLSDTDDQTPGDQVWTTSFTPDQGVTEGTTALQITQPADAWQAGLRLDGGALAAQVAANDKLEFDAFASPDATWRAVWVIMQGDGMGWTQANQVDLNPVGAVQHVVLDLSNINNVDPNDPMAPAPISWKAGAAASPGAWWQIIFAVMGGDAAQPETYTIIDNVKLTSTAPSANFDGDNDVDAADFAIWKAGFGSGPGGDANNDGKVDGTDFLVWQRGFTGPLSVAAGSAVPEPAAGALAVVGAAALGGLRRRSRVAAV
jgi:hypothetical protein